MTKIFLLRIWHDSVWSKVIAVFIVAIIGVPWAWLNNENVFKEVGVIENPPKFLLREEPPSPKSPQIIQGKVGQDEFNSFINYDIPICAGKPNIAIIIDSEKTESGFTPESALYNLLRTEKINLIINLFKEKSFKDNGLFREIYDGNTILLRQANALSNVDYLIIGKLNYSFQKNTNIDSELITCNINFSYKIINKNAEIIMNDSFSVIGPGFSDDASLLRGLEIISENYSDRIIKPNI